MKQKEALLYKLVRPIITIGVKTFMRPKIIGAENIPKSGRIILAGNHTNNFDCLLLMSSTKRCIHFLAKDELWGGIKKIIFGNLGLIPVNRRQKDPDALRLAEAYLKGEKLIGIFPEGTIGKEKLLPFKIGAVKMAKDTDTKIIPFKIQGKYRLFSKDLVICFGEPISIMGSDLEKENKKLRGKIQDMLRGDQ